jgi:DNA-binding response OmpR family regulator
MLSNYTSEYDNPHYYVNSKAEEIDKIVGLEVGADDYMTKPSA